MLKLVNSIHAFSILCRVDLQDADDDEDDKCSLTVALMQTKRRKLKAEEGKPMLTIGFSIYKVLSFNYIYNY